MVFAKNWEKPHFQCFPFPNQKIVSKTFKKTVVDAEFDGLSIAKRIFNFGADLNGEKRLLVKIAQEIRKTAIFFPKCNQSPSYYNQKKEREKLH